MSTTQTLPASEFHRLRERTPDIKLFDVRTPGEFTGVHATGAVNLPLDQISIEALRMHRGEAAGPAYIICKSGARASKACQKLITDGLADVVSIEGGTDAWIAAGLPVVRGRGVMSIERQTRIGAGLLVVIGVVLGLVVHPLFVVLSGAVGAGLVVAGVTDWCGMGLLLGKMPWNQQGAGVSK